MAFQESEKATSGGESVPKDWAYVPREPTDAMLQNTVDASGNIRIIEFTDSCERGQPFMVAKFIYRAMLAASPAPPIAKVPKLDYVGSASPDASEGVQSGEAISLMKWRAIKAHRLCWELSKQHPEIHSLSDDGELHRAIHRIVGVDTPTCSDRPPAAAVVMPRAEVLNVDGTFRTLKGELVDTSATKVALKIARDIYRHANEAGVCALTFAQLIHDEVIAATPTPLAVPVVDEAMAERAWRAGRKEYSTRVKLSKEWDEPNADDIASMKAALTAALRNDEQGERS